MTQNHPLVYGVHGEREEVGDADVDEHRAPLRHHPAGRVQLYRAVLHLNSGGAFDQLLAGVNKLDAMSNINGNLPNPKKTTTPWYLPLKKI